MYVYIRSSITVYQNIRFKDLTEAEAPKAGIKNIAEISTGVQIGSGTLSLELERFSNNTFPVAIQSVARV